MKSILVLIISLIGFSVACSCREGWKKEAYCNSKFIGTIKVQSSSYDCGNEKCYTIAVVEQLRGDKITPTVLTTPSHPGLCGLRLHDGDTYFVATNPIDSDTIPLHFCRPHENWTELSDTELEEGRQEYQKYNCEVTGADQPH